jgi:hypothetical protein
MFVQTYGAALLIILASVVLGQAICVAARSDQRWWAAPAVGFAALIVVAGAAIELPGRGVTAVAAAGLVVTAAAAFLVRRRTLPLHRADIVVCGLSLLATSVPFIASGRVGLPGVSEDNDTAKHLLWAEALRSARMDKLWPTPSGYPLGPHSVVAAVGTATGIPLDMAFTGLLVAIVAITALVAQGVIADQALWRRVVIGLMCSLTYLVAAYYGESAFKETIMAGLLLAFVLHVEQVQAHWSQGSAASRWRVVLPAVIIVAGAVYTYSYLGLAWFGVSAAIWLLAEAALQPAVLFGSISRRNLSSAAPWVAGMVVVAVVLAIPIAGQAISLFGTFGASPGSIGAIPSPLGNLIGSLSPYEALGVWWSTDFRRDPANGFHAGELSAFALAVFAYGFIWSVRRRQLLMPATVVGCGFIWWLAQRTGSPYVAAKALVIAAPVVMALGLRALLTRGEGQLSNRIFVLSAGVIFCGIAAYSSYQELRNEPVQAPEAGRELAAFSHIIGDSAVLFLGDDDYAPWQLRPAAVSTLSADTSSLGDATTRSNKPWVAGAELDFDSVAPADLNRFRYVISSDTPYASQVPASFRLLKSARLYDLWERTGTTVAQQVLEPPGSPGLILNCRTPLGKKLAASPGQASIMATPVGVLGPGLLPGGSAVVSIPLPPGRWTISIQYTSSFDFNLNTEGQRWTMPAYLGRVGPLFGVGTVTSPGVATPLKLTVTSPRPSSVTDTSGNLFTSIPFIVATRVPDTRQIVPISRACGRYVDWYRLP